MPELAPVLPWIPPAIRAILLDDPGFASLVGNRVSTRLANVSAPCATVQATARPIDVSAGAWSPLVQVDAWCPLITPAGDPENVVWTIAARAAAILCRVRNHAYLGVHFSARITDGPLTAIDESRGDNNVLHRAFIRAELTVHAR